MLVFVGIIITVIMILTEMFPKKFGDLLINIFGGIVRCDSVAKGVVDAYKRIGEIKIPIIVRLQGTNAEEGKKIIDESGLKVHSAILLREAAELVTEVLK